MTSSLDTFETALLDELREYVAHRPADPASPGPRRSRRRRLAYAGLAAAAVAGITVAVLPGTGPAPAYAVTEGNGGAVHVRVDRIEDAAGLEQALADHGVAADVIYLDDNQVCAEGRYQEAPPQPHGTQMTFAMGTGGYRVDLAPGAIRDGETIVISIARLTDLGPGESGGITGSIGIATGPVSPCEPVPGPPLPDPGTGTDPGTSTSEEGTSTQPG